MIADEIREKLFSMRDVPYRDFQGALIPTVPKEKLIGVRTPELRRYAKALSCREDIPDFLSALPHDYFDEKQLHAFLLSLMKDFDECVKAVDGFLPFVDNWATCDQLSPVVFRRRKKDLLPYIDSWIESGNTYAVRFAVGMLMTHFLDSDFSPVYPASVAAIDSDEYYINMMIAWYFSTALAKQYEAVIPYFEGRVLDPWTHRKAIQKAVESRRISPEQKAYLKSLK